MSNNRLYIEDTGTGDRLMVAKSFGNGWSWRKTDDEIQKWLDEKTRDNTAAWGNTDNAPSLLRFVTENQDA